MDIQQKTLKYKGRIVFEKLSMPYFKRIPKQYEQNEACFMFVNKGSFSARTPDSFLSFNQTTGILAKCYDYFFETSPEQQRSSDYIEVLGVLMYPDIVNEIFDIDITKSNHKLDFNVKQVQIGTLLENFRSSINILIDNPELADENMIKTKLKEFILLIVKTQNGASTVDFLAGLFKTNSTAFKTTVQNNIYSTLSIDEFAKLCNMSASSFKRKFKLIFETSPQKYFNKMKTDKAAMLLRTTDERISDIAYDCGFDTLTTFNRNFRTRFNMSPSEFRVTQIA